jgi:hypothetical protein
VKYLNIGLWNIEGLLKTSDGIHFLDYSKILSARLKLGEEAMEYHTEFFYQR